MKVKVGDKIYNGDDEPVMVILSVEEKKQIAGMAKEHGHYCVYPDTKHWIDNDCAEIKKWMDCENIELKD